MATFSGGFQGLGPSVFGPKAHARQGGGSWFWRIGALFSAVAACLGLGGCQTDVGRFQQQYQQVQTASPQEKVHVLQKGHIHPNEKVQLTSLEELLKLPGQDVAKARWVVEILQCESNGVYQSALDDLPCLLAANPIQDSQLRAEVSQLVARVPKLERHTRTVRRRTGSGKNRRTRTRTEVYYVRPPASSQYQETLKAVRQRADALESQPAKAELEAVRGQ